MKKNPDLKKQMYKNALKIKKKSTKIILFCKHIKIRMRKQFGKITFKLV